jgi:hypothetical protein
MATYKCKNGDLCSHGPIVPNEDGTITRLPADAYCQDKKRWVDGCPPYRGLCDNCFADAYPKLLALDNRDYPTLIDRTSIYFETQ